MNILQLIPTVTRRQAAEVGTHPRRTGRAWRLIGSLALAAALLGNLPDSHAAEAAQAFATPEEAVRALADAVSTTNRAEFVVLFGDAAKELVNPDSVQGATEMANFATAFQTAHRLVVDSDSRRTLEVGADAWPFPIPLVKTADGWRFDTVAGTDEILNRRIGRNELDVLRVIRAYVQAQREYAAADRDGDAVREFAQHIRSLPGQTDGLFWWPSVNGEISPLGPLFAYAQNEGYAAYVPATQEAGPKPFHGYLFKILKAQGKSAPGGKYRYVINGNMIGGFGLVAWPAEYGNSGVMTFIVNHQGRIYERDLGTKTGKIAAKLDAFDPALGWQVSTD
ncbi:MAG: DUF2950 domain-containing protein [Verrucomicrobia bacterium]|nr:DUF2950 domain-containing protein [Verrucomicrobiota bacterium]